MEILVEAWQRPVKVHFNLSSFKPQKYVAIYGSAITLIWHKSACLKVNPV